MTVDEKNCGHDGTWKKDNKKKEVALIQKWGSEWIW